MAARTKAPARPATAPPAPRGAPPGDGEGDWEIHRLCDKLRRTLLHLRANAPIVYRMTTAFLDFRMDAWLKDRQEQAEPRTERQAKRASKMATD